MIHVFAKFLISSCNYSLDNGKPENISRGRHDVTSYSRKKTFIFIETVSPKKKNWLSLHLNDATVAAPL
jgi:hypothetical protein